MTRSSVSVLLAFLLLSGCGRSAAGDPPTFSASADSALRPVASGRIASDYRGPRSGGIPVRSIYGWVIVGGTKGYIAVNGHCTAYVRSNGLVVGCGVTASHTAFVQKSEIGLFTEPNAKGCLIALAHYHGEINTGSVIPAKYHWVNNSCYKR